jgi:hypothetical protein
VMSAPTSISKRPGDGPLRRESRKRRNMASMKESTISLPPENSIHETMSGGVEQRGWEVGSIGLMSPRPAIRLLSVPQHGSYSSYMSQAQAKDVDLRREKDKRPVTREAGRKRIGDQADEFDAGDIRILLERDAKRREKRKQQQQEKLDRKLRAKASRGRGDSDKKRREADDAQREQEKRERIEQELRSRDFMATPMPVHPALRDEPVFDDDEPVGLGIAAGLPLATTDEVPPGHENALPTTEELGTRNTGTLLDYGAAEGVVENPFVDPLPSPAPEPHREPFQHELPAVYTPLPTPMEDPVLETARAVRMSHASTPPLSPVDSRRATPSMSQLSAEFRSERTTSLPEPPMMPAASAERRTSDTNKDRKAGAWASLFRRGGTNLRKTSDASPAGESSFKNTSRDSMSRGPIPPHLLGNDPSPFQRRKSGTPSRTQSKFREDLPEMPMSPPDSRVQSPEVPDLPAGAAAIAAAQRRQQSKPVDIPGAIQRDSLADTASGSRFDTPTSPTARGHGMMSASMASIGSEGSWLASGGSVKRSSVQSVLSRDVSALGMRRPDFIASYEEVGGDRDAEYMRHTTPGSDAHRTTTRRRISSPALAGADEESGSDYGDESAPPTSSPLKRDPMTVHESVRGKATLVHRDPVARSREGLLTEFASGEAGSAEGDEDEEPESPVGEVRRATSVLYGMGKGHARQMSAGSAKLLDVAAGRRHSLSLNALEREREQ